MSTTCVSGTTTGREAMTGETDPSIGDRLLASLKKTDSKKTTKLDFSHNNFFCLKLCIYLWVSFSSIHLRIDQLIFTVTKN